MSSYFRKQEFADQIRACREEIHGSGIYNPSRLVNLLRHPRLTKRQYICVYEALPPRIRAHFFPLHPGLYLQQRQPTYAQLPTVKTILDFPAPGTVAWS